jgi:hypothetical protein
VEQHDVAGLDVFQDRLELLGKCPPIEDRLRLVLSGRAAREDPARDLAESRLVLVQECRGFLHP